MDCLFIVMLLYLGMYAFDNVCTLASTVPTYPTLYRIPGRVELPRLSSSIECSIGQDPNQLGRTLPRSNPSNIMAACLHGGNSCVVISVFEGDLVWHQLIMKTGLCQCFSSGESLINGVNDTLDGGSDDAASSCGSRNQKQRTIGSFNYRGGDGGERAFSRANVVGWRGDVTK